jgi:hypothetical protein
MADPDLSQFMAAPAKAPPAGPDLSSFMDKPKAATPVGHDLSGFMGDKGPTPEAKQAPSPWSPGQVVADVVGRTKMRAGESMDALKKRSDADKGNLLPNPVHTAENIADIAGVLLSPVGGAGDALGTRVDPNYGKPGSKGGEEKKYGDLAEMVTPIPVEKAVRLAKGAKTAVTGGIDALKAGMVERKAARAAPDLSEFMGKPKAEAAPDLSAFMEAKPLHEDAQGLHAEGSAESAGPIVGNEKDPATRTANALYRLGGGKTADEIEMKQFREGLPPEITDPKVKEELYHAIEQQMVDPSFEIPEHLQPAYQAIKPVMDESRDIINRLMQSKDPEARQFAEDSGFVHRVVPDAKVAEDGSRRDPFYGGKSLVQKASSQKGRKYYVLEGEDGARTFIDDPDKDWKPGDQVPGSFDEPMTVKQATTKEIEANTKTRYQKDAIDNSIKNLLELRRADRNVATLKDTLEDMKARGVAHQEEWTYKDENGVERVARANQETPHGFQSLHDVPQFKGWKFDVNDPQVQELKDWLPKKDEPWLHQLDRVNNFMLRSNFLSPFIHPKNIAEFWGVSRGFDWLHPQGYGTLAKTLPRAVSEVLTMGPAYRRYLREGSALMSGDSRVQGFHAALVNKGAEELTQDPKTVAQIVKSFGLKVGTTARDIYKAVTDVSHKMMWMTGDIMMLQRQLELEAKGLPIREAIKKAEETIPNYRVPAQILKQRWLAQALKNNRLLSIGRYHYNKINAWGTMFKKIAKGSSEERKEALGQFLVAVILGSAVVPVMNKAVQVATGNDKAKLKLGGMLGVPDTAARYAKGDEGLPQAIASVLDISPAATAGIEAITQRNPRTGQNLIEPESTPVGKTAQGLEALGSQFGPTNLAMEAASPTFGAGRMAASQVGVDLPTVDPDVQKAKRQKYGRRTAKGREKKDPLENLLKGLDQ